MNSAASSNGILHKMSDARATRWTYGLVCYGAWLLFSTVWSMRVREPLLTEQITVDPPGEFAAEIHVPYEERYELLMEFDRKGRSFEALEEAFGTTDSEGIPVHVSWSLVGQENGRVLLEQQQALTESWSWSQSSVTRYISHIRVPAGRYQLGLEILEPAPKTTLFPRTATVILRTNAKTATTWQVGLAWWMNVLNGILALLIVMIGIYGYVTGRPATVTEQLSPGNPGRIGRRGQ